MGDSSVIAHAVNSWLEEPAITMDSNGGLHVVYSNDVGVMYTTTVGKEFMITFDDGPVPGNTENIVNALKNIYVGCEPVKAGFFMVGVGCCEDSNCFCPWYDRSPPKGSVRANNDLVQMVAREHHYIGIHTQHHPDFNAWFKDWSIESIKKEISDCYNEIRKALNSDNPNDVNIPKIFRPPYFSNNPNVQEAAKGFQMILGAGNNENAATADVGWRPFFWPITVDSIKNKAANLIREWDRDYPCVLTFHDISPVTPDNIAEIIRYLRKEGFTLVNFDPSRLPGRLPSLVHHAQNTIHQSEIVTHTVSLDSTVSTVTFNVSWEGSDLDLVLYKPDGTKIEPNSTLVDPNIKYAERDTYEYYTVSDPNPGNWIMEVSGVNVPPMGESYTIRVEADSNLALSAFTEKPDYELNENINMSAQLVNDENSVTGALVMAKVQRPDGSVDNLVLYDDGEHGDKDPNDGFYANAYDNTSLRGLYKLTTFAIGELTGDQYERASSLTVMVGSIIYGEVDFRAYAVLADHWLAQNCTEPNWCDTADLDQNGQVDIFDLGILVEYWLEDTNP
jgi:peptidoglycan/xylan/chitin deacetylase (PgdA/CDA1 family)